MVDFSTSDVSIHPSAVLSIIQFHERRTKSKANVIGTLFGVRKAHKVTIGAAFVVEHTATEGEPISIDMHAAEQYVEWHRRAHPYDVVVGWFSTNAKITESERSIHEFYQHSLCKTPIFVTLDTTLPDTKLDIKAYVVTPFGLENTCLGFIFSAVNAKVAWQRQEQILVDRIKQVEIEIHQSQRDEDVVFHSIMRLHKILKLVMDHVREVVEGRKIGDPEIGRQLSIMLQSIPRIPRSELDSMFNIEKNDLLAAGYLIQWIKEYLPMHDSAVNVPLKAFH